MADIAPETVIQTKASGTSLGPDPYQISAVFGVFSTDCTVAGTSIATTIGTVASHVAATVAHGATGAVVGTTNVQVLSGKTIDSATNTITISGTPIDTVTARHWGTLSATTPPNALATAIVAAGPYVPLNTVFTLNSSGFSSPSAGVLRCNKADTYFVNYAIQLEAATPGVLYESMVFVNGSAVASTLSDMSYTIVECPASGYCSLIGSGTITMAVNDTLELRIHATVNSNPRAAFHVMTATRIN